MPLGHAYACRSWSRSQSRSRLPFAVFGVGDGDEGGSWWHEACARKNGLSLSYRAHKTGVVGVTGVSGAQIVCSFRFRLCPLPASV